LSSSGTLRKGDIERALDKCLPGCRWFLGEHRWHVYPPGKAPPFYLPRGKQGDGDRAEVQRGQVKRMARQFGVTDCFRKELPGL